MRRKARRLTVSILGSSAEFWLKTQTRATDGILRNANVIYNKISWRRPKQAEHFLRLSLSHCRRNDVRNALSTLEEGLNQYPESEILLEAYLRICSEEAQLVRVIDFINPTKKTLCETLSRIRVLHSASGHDSLHKTQKHRPVRLTAEIIGKNFGDDVLKLWRLADLLEHAGKTDIASIIHRQLATRTANDVDDFLYGGVSDMRLGNVDAGFRKLRLGLARFPDSDNLKSVFKDCCLGQLDFDRYLQSIDLLDNAEAERPRPALEFYRQALSLNLPAAFLVKSRDAGLNCGATDFITLQQEFLEHLRANPPSLEKAKLWIFLSRLLGLNAEFSERMFLVLHSLDWGKHDSTVKPLLGAIYKLTLPLVPHHEFDSEEIISKFAVEAQALSQQPMSMSEPISDFGKQWAVWVSLFCLAQPKLYHQTMSGFEQFAFKFWPRLDYTAPHVRPLAIQENLRRKIRIGFTVLDSMPMMSGLMERLDKDVFETVFLRAGRSGDSKTANEWIERADITVEYSDDNAYEAIETIAEQELDILISGPCVPQIFFPLMARLAHLHMVLLEPNWPDGIKNSDYYISWQLGEPKNYKDFYKTSVSLLQTPPYWIERPSLDEKLGSSPDIRHRLLDLGPDNRFYLCANTPPKIHPQMDAMLYALLERDPTASLVFLRGDHSPAHLLRARFKEKLGKHYERVIFVNSLEKDDAHSLLLSADCCIDSFPICGMSSSFDGIMLGVPIVTLPTEIPFGRWTAAIYEYLEVSGLTARNVDEYIGIAIRLSTDKVWRLEKSAELREKSSLYVESKASFDEFQNFIVQAWRRKQVGLPLTSWVAGEWQ